ncbi:MAG: class I SAM-dependent methyltransferase [Clostridia bacterium]|nr:MAG: class I SAM-dependent methyltransferase [Clostridia bacterium]
MREEDIRPARLMERYRRLQAEDAAALLSHRDSFAIVPCPACDSWEQEPTFEKGGFNFVTCAECKTLYISPRPTASLLAGYYSRSSSLQYWNDYIFPASEHARRANIFAPRVKRLAELLERFSPSATTLVDVGAGYGTFLEELRKLATVENLIAIEPSPGLAATCRTRGLTVIEKPVEEVARTDLPDEVDVVTCFELIEHLFAPRDFLMVCRSLLGERGLLVLTTPNIQGFDLLTLGPLSDNIGGPNHLNYFNEASLRLLLGRSGFYVIECMTPGELDAEIVHKKVVTGELDLSDQPFLYEVLVNRWEDLHGYFQAFLAEHNLSSHMWVVARPA